MLIMRFPVDGNSVFGSNKTSMNKRDVSWGRAHTVTKRAGINSECWNKGTRVAWVTIVLVQEKGSKAAWYQGRIVDFDLPAQIAPP